MKLFAAKFILISIVLFSCKTTKYVDRIKTVTDSTAIKQRDALARVLKEEVERFEKEKEQWDSLGVQFYPPVTGIIGGDPEVKTPCPDGLYVPKIIFDNGRIKSIEGNIKSLNQSLYEKQAEVYDAHSLIDSLTLENEKLETQLSKKEVVVHKEIERTTYVPWWVYVIAGLSILFGSHPYVKNIYNKIKKSWQKTQQESGS